MRLRFTVAESQLLSDPPESNRRIEPFRSELDRSAFSCQSPPLDRYLREVVGQDTRRGFATCFVALEANRVAGYYTISMGGVPIDLVPQALRRKMPRYPTVPAVRLGRLAVDHRYRGRGLGRCLLVDAMGRALASEIAWAVFVVDAVDDAARSFYEPYGFVSFGDHRNHLFLRRRTVEQAFAGR
jgi:ribosomal protein S18 acetylase RimI-like enzyme